jgi:hypothetical protein
MDRVRTPARLRRDRPDIHQRVLAGEPETTHDRRRTSLSYLRNNRSHRLCSSYDPCQEPAVRTAGAAQVRTGTINQPDRATPKNVVLRLAQQMAADPNVTPAATQGRPRKEDKVDHVHLNKLNSNSAEHIVRRLKRDHPEIAALCLNESWANRC